VTQQTSKSRSLSGVILMAVYLVIGGILFYEALTCSGWLCDLTALPAVFPVGLPIAWITDWINYMYQIPGHVPTFHIRNWYFIVPTMLANAVFYYCLGSLGGRLIRKIHSRWSAAS
jgi:hypothetical protein